jgi:hypothetical protein
MTLWKVQRHGSQNAATMYVRDPLKVEMYKMLNRRNTHYTYTITELEA